MDNPVSGVPGIGRTRSLVAALAAQEAASLASTNSSDELASTTTLATTASLAQLVELAQLASSARPVAFHLPAETSELVDWLCRALPTRGRVLTRSQAVAVAVRLLAGVVSELTGEALPEE